MKVIQVENLSKLYRLGQVGTGSIFHDVNRWWHTVRGKEDPYTHVGEVNDRTQKGKGDYVWALKNINFEVEQGEVLGIIGSNGAGKSTLLKILSRTTGPTTGTIKVKGRIASLLEVGTGFHPELSGRDNIFMNGTILGMTRSEIKSKFDEIVEFAGVERYLDTPVKRYSSGMYVRLAFAVAAHLESEILIIDEVLAVGDIEFQKKCLGKMKDVSEKQGRTVMFVSHNMKSIASLSQTLLVMEKGMTNRYEEPLKGIDIYNKKLTSFENSLHVKQQINRLADNEFIEVIDFFVSDLSGQIKSVFSRKETIVVNLLCNVKKVDPFLTVGISVLNDEDYTLFWSIHLEVENPISINEGIQKIQILIPTNHYNAGSYRVELIAAIHNQKWLYKPNHNSLAINFSLFNEIEFIDVWASKRQGCLVPSITYKNAN